MEALASRFGIGSNVIPELKPRYNVAPTQNALVILGDPGGSPHAAMLKWGIRPPSSKEEKYKPIIHLRSKTVLNRPVFNRYLEASRCIIPVDGYFEWRTDKLPTHKIRKTPFRYQPRPGFAYGIYGLGGLYAGDTFCLITTEANPLASRVHDRMPVIIPPEADKAWLNPETKQADYVACLAPYPDTQMVAYEVSSVVNSSESDTPECISPATVQRTCK